MLASPLFDLVLVAVGVAVVFLAVVIALAVELARLITRIVSVLVGVRLSRIARTPAEVACVVVAIATAAVRQPQVVIAIEILGGLR